MDFQLTDDQQALVDALQAILADHADLPQDERLNTFCHDPALQALLADTGFLDAARSMGPLEAALVGFETARSLFSIEAMGTGLAAPMTLPDMTLAGPVAIVAERDLERAIRNLPVARTLLVDCGEDVVIVPVDPAGVEPVASIYGYPYGRFGTVPDLARGHRVAGKGAALRQWWRVGLAVEIAGAARAAIDFTIDYVGQRTVFGRPVGSFQSVQHRLVQRHGHAKAGYYLAMRAAWSQDPRDADIAATHAVQGIQALLFDLHQFNGGMGVTLEYSLHFWTYRIRALQAETGGLTGMALEIAERRWGKGAGA
jgi:alkylation response protein AidB-like acyl-CoA dehydrogenase